MNKQKQRLIDQLQLLLLSWKEGPHGATSRLRGGTPADGTGVSRRCHDVESASVGKTAHWAQLWLLKETAWVTLDRNRKATMRKRKKMEKTFPVTLSYLLFEDSKRGSDGKG